ncbi:small nuclear ribonucleoprotein [Candidatus Pacearchaeota archaeon]|nr:small nuclear ribonucleoprotein [Candidatus Pacearchaeota archaeon]
MVSGIERPLDLLNKARGKEILVQLKNDKQLVGTLLAFDIHINVVMDNAKEIENNAHKRNIGLTFLRGDTIIFISPSTVSAEEKQ